MQKEAISTYSNILSENGQLELKPIVSTDNRWGIISSVAAEMLVIDTDMAKSSFVRCCECGNDLGEEATLYGCDNCGGKRIHVVKSYPLSSAFIQVGVSL